MVKNLWKFVGDLKTPERRLLFGLMLMAIIVLLIYVNRASDDRSKRISQLEVTNQQLINSKDSIRAMMQEKLDTCTASKINILAQLFEKTEQLKRYSQNLEP